MRSDTPPWFSFTWAFACYRAALVVRSQTNYLGAMAHPAIPLAHVTASLLRQQRPFAIIWSSTGGCQLSTKCQIFVVTHIATLLRNALVLLLVYSMAADMQNIKEGWFTETSPLWPGQATSFQIEEVLYHKKSKFQDVMVFKRWVLFFL